MKKTLVALASLAALGTSFAQSSMTIYGNLDQTLVQISQGGKSATSTASNNNSSSYWGITSTEDMGGGVIVGRGGKLISATYYHDFKGRNKELVNERMVFEVGKSVEVAYEIAPLLDLYEIPLEIHADINPDPRHESNKALQQAIGYILGMGYSFKVKPDAWTASYAADHKC